MAHAKAPKKDQKTNLYLGGYEGDIYTSLAKATFTDTREHLRANAKDIAAAVEGARAGKNKSSLLLGAEELDYKTMAQTQFRDNTASLVRDPQEALAERGRKMELQVKHFELGDGVDHWDTLAADTFKYDEVAARAIGEAGKANVKKRSIAAQRTSFEIGADVVTWRSMAKSDFTTPAVDRKESERQGREPVPPMARETHVMIGLDTNDYQTTNGASGAIVADAYATGEAGKKFDVAAATLRGRATHLVLGEDDMTDHYLTVSEGMFRKGGGPVIADGGHGGEIGIAARTRAIAEREAIATEVEAKRADAADADWTRQYLKRMTPTPSPTPEGSVAGD